MSTTGKILEGLIVVVAELITMLAAFDDAEGLPARAERREVKRPVIRMRDEAQELIDELCEVRARRAQELAQAEQLLVARR